MEICPSIFVLDRNENSREILKSYLLEIGIENVRLYNDYLQGLEDIKNSQDYPIVFFDMTENAAYDEIIESLRLHTNRIIITSTNYSADTIVKAMRYGAKEFLPKPIIKEDLRRIISMLCHNDEKKEDSISKIITVYSNKGGIGKTTIATNLALELSKVVRDKVALIDLNLQLGDISTFLNLNPTFDVGYVIKNLVSKDENIMLKAFERYKDSNLYILSDPNYIEQSESITPQQIDGLFKSLKRIFPYIIVDMSSNIDPNSLKILDDSDWVLFTTIVNIPAIRNAQRCLNLFRSRRYPNDKVRVIINRYMENDEISIEDIENIYLPMDFTNFKLEGRTTHPLDLIEILLYYLIKEEYQPEVRDLLQISIW